MTQTNKNIFYFMMVLAMAGWGASWVNAKVLSAYIDEYQMMFLRNFFTIITLAPILVITRKFFYTNIKSLILAFIAAIVMIAYLKFYFLGVKFGTASLGGALVTTMIPINTFIPALVPCTTSSLTRSGVLCAEAIFKLYGISSFSKIFIP